MNSKNRQRLRAVVITLQILFFVNCLCTDANAQDPSESSDYKNDQSDWPAIPKPFLDAVLFGIEAGFLVGVAAVTGFRTNFRQNMDLQNISRGMSYGLYGGIILGIYITSASNHSQSQQARVPHVIPVFDDNKIDGALVNFDIAKF